MKISHKDCKACETFTRPTVEAAPHSDKWSSCAHDIIKKGKSGAVDPYAVCTSALGRQSSEAATGSGMAAVTRAGVREGGQVVVRVKDRRIPGLRESFTGFIKLREANSQMVLTVNDPKTGWANAKDIPVNSAEHAHDLATKMGAENPKLDFGVSSGNKLFQLDKKSGDFKSVVPGQTLSVTKGKGGIPVGTIHQWGGKDFEKVAPGKWKRVKK